MSLHCILYTVHSLVIPRHGLAFSGIQWVMRNTKWKLSSILKSDVSLVVFSHPDVWYLKSLQTGSLIDGEFHWKEEHHSHNKSIKILILHRNEYFNPIRGGGGYFSLIGLTKGVLQTSLPPRFYKYHLFKCSYMHKKNYI